VTQPVRFALVGAGDRGRNTYGAWCLAHPDRARVVAVADPNTPRRDAFAVEHGIGPERAFEDWAEMLASGPAVDAVIVASPDREHAGPTIAALERGHDVLLEKPIAPTEFELHAVAEAEAASAGRVTVAHVLRYTAFFTALKGSLDAGEIGDLVTITHAERIGYWHFAHSFVRGSWRREDQSSPMILAKACHDLDLIRWLAGDRCMSVASYGGLRHFRSEEAPDGALDRCWDGERRCPAAPACPFDAVRLYVERTAGVTDWPVSVITDDPSPDGRMAALAHGPYGRCVYASDNDVADHQVTALEFANGVRATLTVSGLTPDNTRTIVLGGTRGELAGRLDTGRIELRRFLPGAVGAAGPWDRDEQGRQAMRDDDRRVIDTAAVLLDGHGGGDDAMLDDVVGRLIRRRDAGDDGGPTTGLAAAMESHRMAFAAEQSRHERRLVELESR
jgi:predicted dehydrogenase